MKSIFHTVFLLVSAHCTLAGNLNIINLTAEPLDLVLKTGSGEKNLVVGQGAASGSFKLGEEQVTLRAGHKEEVPELEVPSDETSRLAILYPAGDSAEWKLLPSRAKRDKWRFHVVNLTGGPIGFTHLGEDVLIEEHGEMELKVSGVGGVKIMLPGGEPQSPGFREPRTVIAFLSKDGEETIVTFVSDL